MNLSRNVCCSVEARSPFQILFTWIIGHVFEASPIRTDISGSKGLCERACEVSPRRLTKVTKIHIGVTIIHLPGGTVIMIGPCDSSGSVMLVTTACTAVLLLAYPVAGAKSWKLKTGN